MDQTSHSLGVYLHAGVGKPVRVGSLLRDAKANVSFHVDEAYLALGPSRPVLSSAWSTPGNDPLTMVRLRMRQDKQAPPGTLPAWFSNLLPEGVLREMVEKQMGVGPHDEFDLLERLGRDLPGAVVVANEAPVLGSDLLPPAEPEKWHGEESFPIKFSLAGVQLKFSMVQSGDRLTIPAKNQTGRVIVKLPSDQYPLLPECEYAAMQLAAAVGVKICGCELVPVTQLTGLNERFLLHGKHALAVSRFDRRDDRRIHMEDFAQILGAVGNRKYTAGNEETNLKLLSRFIEDGHGAVLQAVRRIVVNILVGNADAHLKNWSLIYPDGLHPELSPAYDIVPTVIWLDDDTSALKFGGTKNMASIGFSKFQRAAKFVEMDERALHREARRTMAQAADTWPALLKELPLPAKARRLLQKRWKTLALCRERKNALLEV